MSEDTRKKEYESSTDVSPTSDTSSQPSDNVPAKIEEATPILRAVPTHPRRIEEPVTSPAPQMKSCCGGAPATPKMANNASRDKKLVVDIQENQPVASTMKPKEITLVSSPQNGGYPAADHMPPTPVISTIYGTAGGVPIHSADGHFQVAPDHNCACGEGCNCIGCAAHPNNVTTKNYVLSWQQFQENQVQAHLANRSMYSSGPPGNMYIYDNGMHPNTAFNSSQQITGPNHTVHQQLAHGAGNYTAGAGPNRNDAIWMQNRIVSPPSNSYYPNNSMPLPATQTVQWQPWDEVPAQNEMAGPEFAADISLSAHFGYDGTYEGGVEEYAAYVDEENSPEATTPTLSPSSYHLQTLVLPGCNDVTGTCQCGDGCACVGCLTHGGHNGVPLAPSRIEHGSALQNIDGINGHMLNTDY
jgi:hypothetical protein